MGTPLNVSPLRERARLTRRTVMAAGALLAIAPAAACQGGASGTDATLRPASGPVKLTLLHAWGAGGRLPLMEKMRDEFQQRNPTITVDFDVISTEQGMNSPRVQKLVTAVPITPVDAEADAVLNKAMSDVAEKRGAVRNVVRQAAVDVQRELEPFWARQGS